MVPTTIIILIVCVSTYGSCIFLYSLNHSRGSNTHQESCLQDPYQLISRPQTSSVWLITRWAIGWRVHRASSYLPEGFGIVGIHIEWLAVCRHVGKSYFTLPDHQKPFSNPHTSTEETRGDKVYVAP